MRNHSMLLPAIAALLLSAVVAAPSAVAQSQREIEQERAQVERERVQAEQQREQERASVQAELQRAREEMERAAREVARLSQEFAGPYVRNMTRSWQSIGSRAMLGLNIEDTELGVRVAGVSPNGPAAGTGIAIGDVIVGIDGAALADPRPTGRGRRSPSQLLLAQIRNVEPGEKVTLKVQRDGQEREVEIQTREREDFSFDFDGAPFRMSRAFFMGNPWREMQLVTLTPELGSYFGTESGVLVVRGPGNDALGLRDGDVILDIGGRVPTSPEHAIRILGSFAEGESLRINIMRRERRQTLELTVPTDTNQ